MIVLNAVLFDELKNRNPIVHIEVVVFCDVFFYSRARIVLI